MVLGYKHDELLKTEPTMKKSKPEISEKDRVEELSAQILPQIVIENVIELVIKEGLSSNDTFNSISCIVIIINLSRYKKE